MKVVKNEEEKNESPIDLRDLKARIYDLMLERESVLLEARQKSQDIEKEINTTQELINHLTEVEK